jgi:hypothetical protein
MARHQADFAQTARLEERAVLGGVFLDREICDDCAVDAGRDAPVAEPLHAAAQQRIQAGHGYQRYAISPRIRAA